MAHPQIAVFARTADGAEATTRRIEGQETLLTRTMHAIHYNPVRDEIVVPNQFAQAVITFKGSASGEETPLRVIQGDKTQMRGSDVVVVDYKNNEYIVEDRVFPILADGNVAPTRVLPYEVEAVDMDNNLYISMRRNKASVDILIYDRSSDSDKPLRTIAGPKTMLVGIQRMRVHNGWILVAHDGVQADAANNLSFVGVWSVMDDGDVPPRWTYGGPNKMLSKPRGIDVDIKNQSVIVSDKNLNAVLTYHAPEIFGAPGARSSRRGERVPTARTGSGTETLAENLFGGI